MTRSAAVESESEDHRSPLAADRWTIGGRNRRIGHISDPLISNLALKSTSGRRPRRCGPADVQVAGVTWRVPAANRRTFPLGSASETQWPAEFVVNFVQVEMLGRIIRNRRESELDAGGSGAKVKAARNNFHCAGRGFLPLYVHRTNGERVGNVTSRRPWSLDHPANQRHLHVNGYANECVPGPSADSKVRNARFFGVQFRMFLYRWIAVKEFYIFTFECKVIGRSGGSEIYENAGREWRVFERDFRFLIKKRLKYQFKVNVFGIKR